MWGSDWPVLRTQALRSSFAGWLGRVHPSLLAACVSASVPERVFDREWLGRRASRGDVAKMVKAKVFYSSQYPFEISTTRLAFADPLPTLGPKQTLVYLRVQDGRTVDGVADVRASPEASSPTDAVAMEIDAAHALIVVQLGAFPNLQPSQRSEIQGNPNTLAEWEAFVDVCDELAATSQLNPPTAFW